MTKMLWSGRFSQNPGKLLLEYTSAENVVLDERLIPYDILGSEAHVSMLCKQQILTIKEAKQILKALNSIRGAYEKGGFVLKEDLEDVHMNVETFVIDEIGEVGGKMHTARSRNDQINLDTRLYLRDEINEIIENVSELELTLIRLGKRNLQTLMPGYTHTRIAQPITLAFWLSSHVQGFQRDVSRLENLYPRMNINPLGACALAGTTWNINRELTAEFLGFNGIQQNALDVVTSRGEFEAELLSVLSIIMMRLSRISEELILFSSSEFGFFELSDRYATGSSIMPQKKNPDALELMRARCARVYGYLMQVLSTVKNLISGHNADTQETKYATFMAIDVAKASLSILNGIMKTTKINKARMRNALERDFASATDFADMLAKKGIPFRQAHAIAGSLVKKCIAKKISLSEVTPNMVKGIKLTSAEIKGATDLLKIVQQRRSGPSPDNSRKMLQESEKKVQESQSMLYERRKSIKQAVRKFEQVKKSITR